MRFVQSKPMVLEAQKAGYAIPALNTNGANYDIARAALEAAQEKKSPLIIQVYEGNIGYRGYGYFVHMVDFLCDELEITVPVAIHLDHGKSLHSIVNAIKAGFTSIMFDASHKPLDQNIAEIESGDREQVEFYYFDHTREDPVCEGLVSKGRFVTREDIFKYPRLVPPFHLGCACRLTRQHVTDDVRKTIALNMRPLLTDDKVPPKLPNWHTILKLP